MTMGPNLGGRKVVRQEVTSVEREPADVVVPMAAGEESTEVVEQTGGVERRERIVADASGSAHGERFVRDVAGEQWLWLTKASQVIWFCIGVIEVLIGLRVILKLIAANPANDFAHFIYSAAGVFVAPFFGLTGTPAADGMVLEIPSLIAMAVYALVGWGLVRLIWLLFYRPPTGFATMYDRYQR